MMLCDLLFARLVCRSDPPRAVVTAAPVFFAHVCHHDRLAAAGGMHETLFADIDADMRERLLARVEEHQVAGVQLTGIRFASCTAHLRAGARQLYSKRVQVHMLHETAAIEAVLA